MSASTRSINTVMNIITTLISTFCIGAKKLECCGGTKKLRRDGQEKELILVEWLDVMFI